MATSQSQSFKGGSVSPGASIEADDLKNLVVNRKNDVGIQQQEIYEPLVGKVFNIGRAHIKVNGTEIGSYDPLDTEKDIDIDVPAAQVQSDWDEADSTKPDYIKNKPNLGLKADKVQGATAGNLAALDANGNLTDSGKKIADFKIKQTAVSVTGGTLKGVASMSQNANGEVTLTLNDIQDGTTAQKGVVQLQDSIGSTESATDKAVTPHAVREAIRTTVSSAYHAAGTKTVAQLTSSLLVAGNEGSVYNITDSGTTTSDFVDGAGHPINAGDNVGVCDVGSGVYKFDLLSGFVDLSDYLAKTGNASNTTSVLTKNASDGSSMASGSKLSVLFTAISNFFASFKALAFKDKVSTGDISDDAITAAKVKDNETLPVEISGSSHYISPFIINKGSQTPKSWAKVATAPAPNNYLGFSFTGFISFDGYMNEAAFSAIIEASYRSGANGSYVGHRLNLFTYRNYGLQASIVRTDTSLELWVKAPLQDTDCHITCIAHNRFVTNYADSNDRNKQLTDSEFSAYIADKTKYDASVRTLAFNDGISQVGSPSTPVYVDADGQVRPCDSIDLGTPKHSATITSGAGVVYYTSPADTFAIAINYDRANSKAYITVNNATSGRQLYVSLGHSNSLTPVAYADNVVIVGTISEYNLFDLDILCMGIGDEMPVFSFTIGIQVNESKCTYTIYDRMKYHL